MNVAVDKKLARTLPASQPHAWSWRVIDERVRSTSGMLGNSNAEEKARATGPVTIFVSLFIFAASKILL